MLKALAGPLDWQNWVYGLVAGFIGGGSSAVVSGLTVSLSDPKDYAIGSTKFFVLVTTIFVTNGAMSAFMFLKQNPLPQIKTVTLTERTTQQSNPATVITEKIEKTVTQTDKSVV